MGAPLIAPPSPRAPRHEPHISAMTIRTRKFFGTIALLVLVVVWSLLGMTIAQTPWLANSGLLQAIFYVVAGLGLGAAPRAVLRRCAGPPAAPLVKTPLA